MYSRLMYKSQPVISERLADLKQGVFTTLPEMTYEAQAISEKGTSLGLAGSHIGSAGTSLAILN
ncbi:hypothetical protein M513_01295 [Trichuris suis]|uniref:Uncharacterized protein n=1 Tax=Trichuris suis TaxID=68888 RepID=A0A085MK79_9BILA|nr:hypothetical protein M513_01295 [Trichuris suis]